MKRKILCMIMGFAASAAVLNENRALRIAFALAFVLNAYVYWKEYLRVLGRMHENA